MSRREAFFNLLSTCLLVIKFRLVMMLCSNLGNKIYNAGQVFF